MATSARILVADDEEIILLSTADLLRQEGYTVDTAADGKAVVRLLGTVRYDLLITDINMPGNSELELLRGLPELNLGLPVILMTGYPSAHSAIRAVNASVLAYLVKPTVFQELLAQVQRGVAQRRLQLAVTASARRIQDWAGEMAQLADGIGTIALGGGGIPVQHLLGAMLGRMGESLLDMKHLVDLSTGLEGAGHACSVHNCPRLETYDRILHEGIDILEKTKGAFKSRNLEDLRIKMEGVLAAPDDVKIKKP